MIPEEDRNDLDDLDRLVDRELQLLVGRYRPRQALAGRCAPKADAAGAGAEAAGRREVRPDNVVRAHPLARPPRRRTPGHLEGLFARDEEAFLANAADWLESRPNADILLDALARRVLGGEPPATAPTRQEDGWQLEPGDIATSPDEDWGDDPDATPPGVDAAELPAHKAEAEDERGSGSLRRQDSPGTSGDDPDA